MPVSVSDAIAVSPFPRRDAQPGLARGRTKTHPSYSARKLLKECFVENPATHIDLHQQRTEMNTDQVIQIAKAVALEVSCL